jgi:cell wall assembly regulator SMI1
LAALPSGDTRCGAVPQPANGKRNCQYARTVKSTIETVHNKLNELYSIITPWGEEGDRSTLHDGATDEEVARAEARFGHQFPPSYKEFLRLHSAWQHFWGNATLIGIGAPATQNAQDKIAEYREWQTNLLKKRLGELSAATIAAWESKEEQNLYLPNHLVVGTDFSGAVWVYDTRTRRADGEMKLTFWEMSYGAQDPTFETFDQFLASWIDEVDFRLEHARKADDDEEDEDE